MADPQDTGIKPGESLAEWTARVGSQQQPVPQSPTIESPGIQEGESLTDWSARRARASDPALNYAVTQGLTKDPERSARLLTAQYQTGYSLPFIDRNLDNVESEVKRTAFSIERLRAGSPLTAKFLSENPERVGLFAPDLRGLTAAEQFLMEATNPDIRLRAWTPAERVDQAKRRAEWQFNDYANSPSLWLGWGTVDQRIVRKDFEERALDEINAQEEAIAKTEQIGFRESLGNRFALDNPVPFAPLIGNISDLEKAGELYRAKERLRAGGDDLADQELLIREWRYRIAAARRGQSVGGNLADLMVTLPQFIGSLGMTKAVGAGVKGAIVSGTETLAAQRLGSLLGLATRVGFAAPVDIVKDIYQRMAPEGQPEADKNGNFTYKIKTNTGEELSVAVPKAVLSSLIDYGTADIQLNPLFKAFASKTPGATPQSFLRTIYKEGVSGALSFIGLNEATKMAKDVLEVGPHYELPTSESAIAQGIVGAFLHVVSPVMERMGAISDNEKARGVAETLAKTAEIVKAMQADKKAPEIVEQALGTMVKGTNRAFTSVDPHDFELHYEQKGVEPHAFATELTGRPDALKEALDAGHPLQIPTEAYISRIGKTDSGAFFQDKVRFDPMAPGSAEAQKHLGEVDAKMEAERKAKEEAKKAKEDKTQGLLYNEDRKEVAKAEKSGDFVKPVTLTPEAVTHAEGLVKTLKDGTTLEDAYGSRWQKRGNALIGLDENDQEKGPIKSLDRNDGLNTIARSKIVEPKGNADQLASSLAQQAEKNFGSSKEEAGFFGKLVASGLKMFGIRARQSAKEMEKYVPTLEKGETPTPESLQQPAPPDTEEFKSWFAGSQVTNEAGKPIVVFHGSQRPDRVGSRFRKSRATSGPMAFFTTDPDIGSKYATGKRDTSLEQPDSYDKWFTFKPKGSRSPVSIDRAWYYLTPEERAKIADLAPRVTFNPEGSGEIQLAPEGHKTGTGGYDLHIQEAKGNHLKALVEEWLTSGNLFNDEDKFLKVLDLAGFKGAKLEDPNATYPSVFPVFLNIKKPLDTSAIPPQVIDALEQRANKIRKKPESYGADLWDKRTRDAKEWVATLKEDYAKGVNSHAWSSIPDWVTETLKEFGYDGIKDLGGKMGGVEHHVWVPFEETQIKSATGNRGTFDPSNPNILFQGANVAPPFYHKIQKVIEEKMPASAPVEQVRGLIKDLKPEEIKWSGIEDFLKDKPKVSKEELLTFLRLNQLEIKEVMKGQEVKENPTAARAREILDEARRNRDDARETLRQKMVGAGIVNDGFPLTDNLHILKDPDIHEKLKKANLLDYLYNYQDLEQTEYEAWTNSNNQDELARSQEPPRDTTKFNRPDLNIPGGENYRELLLIMPPRDPKPTAKPEPVTALPEGFDPIFDRASVEGFQWGVMRPGQNYARSHYGWHPTQREATAYAIDRINEERQWAHEEGERLRKQENIVHGHHDEPNAIAWVRFDDRVDSEGKKVAFLQELQSDWHQRGRKKGYKGDVEKVQTQIDALQKEHDKILHAQQDEAVAFQKAYSEQMEPMLNQYPPAREHEYSARVYQLGQYVHDESPLGTPGRGLYERSDGKPRSAVEEAFIFTNSQHKANQEIGALEKQIASLRKKTSEALPEAPFKKTWHEFALKRMIRYAAENGYDALAWTTGEQQAERYDLSKKVKHIAWEKNFEGEPYKVQADGDGWAAFKPNGERLTEKYSSISELQDYLSKTYNAHAGSETYNLDAPLPNGEPGVHKEDLTFEDLEKLVGKDIAKKIANGEGREEKGAYRTWHILEGDDLQVGGHGMKGFYDDMLQAFASKFGKKYGAKVEDIRIGADLKPKQAEANAAAMDLDVALLNAGLPRAELESISNNWAQGGRERAMQLDKEAVLKYEEVYKKSKMAPAHSLAITPELRKAAVEEGFSMFQPGAAGPRGEYVPRDITGNKPIIRAYQSYDPSTLGHEPGHLFLDILADLSQRPEADQFESGHNVSLKQDFQTFLDWRGIKDAETWQKMTLAEKTPHHEAWADAYEQWLFEGKAPSLALRQVFYRFRQWLGEVYDKFNGKGIEIPDQIRAVFERIHASDAEIQQAKERMGRLEPFIEDIPSMVFTQAEHEKMAALQADANLHAVERMDTEALSDIKEQQSEQYQHAKAIIQEEVTKDFQDTKEAKALAYFKDWKTADGQPLPEGTPLLRLSAKDVANENPGLELKSLPRGVLDADFNESDGISPKAAADIFGFDSGEELVKALINTKPEEWIKTETEARASLNLADPMKTLPEDARAAIHGDAEQKLKIYQMEWLAKNKLPERDDLIRKFTDPVRYIKELRGFAETKVEKLTIENLDPRIWERGEKDARKAAREAILKNDIPTAIAFKERETLNHEIFRAATEAKEEFKDSQVFVKKLFQPDADLAKSRDMDLVNAGRAILAEFGLGKSEKSAADWLKPISLYDSDVYETIKSLVDSAIAGAKPYEKATIGQLREMKVAVEALWDLAKRSREMMIAGRLVDKELGVEATSTRLKAVDQSYARQGFDKKVSDWEKTKIGLMGLRGAVRRVESWGDAVDGNDPTKPMTTYITRPIFEATTNFREAKKQNRLGYMEDVKLLDQSKLTEAEIPAPELNYTFKDKGEVIAAILHSGNVGPGSNLEKNLLGRGWARRDAEGVVDTSRWEAFRARMIQEGVLTKDVYDYAQAVWDRFEAMKVDAQKAHKDMYGFYFKEITANPIETPWGTYRGGYVPAIVDPLMVKDAAQRAEKQALEKNDNSFMFPTTGRDFTKSRSAGYTQPLMMDLGLLPVQFDKVLRFIHIEQAIKDVGRVVFDKTFRNALDAFDPAVAGDMLVPWLQRTAQQRTSEPTKGWAGRAMDTACRYLRARTGMQMMVANIANAMQQATGISSAALKVEPANLRDALWEYTKRPGEVAKEIDEKSVYMRNRSSLKMMELQSSIDDILLNPTTWEKAQDIANKHGYFFQEGVQNVVDRITWMGAYGEAVEKGMNEADSVAHADSVVRQTQFSNAPEDISRFEAGSPFLRIFTMFTSHYNMRANLLTTEFTKSMRDFGLRKGAGRALYIYTMGFMIPAVIGAAIEQAWSGHAQRAAMNAENQTDDDSYMWEFMKFFFGSQARSAAAMVPVVGPIVTSTVSNFTGKGGDNLNTSPAVTAIEHAVTSPHSVYKAITGDGKPSTAIRDTATALGIMTGLPFGALARPVGYLADVAHGDEQPTGPIDFTRGLISGHGVPKK